MGRLDGRKRHGRHHAVAAGRVGGDSGSAAGAPQPQRAGVCFSRSLSEKTGAVVQVACDSGQFVSIEAVPGQRFLGVHGGAFRYTLSIAKDRSVYEAAANDAFGWRTGWGTVTMLRLYDLTQPISRATSGPTGRSSCG